MKIAIHQPKFLPYLGYWQLIYAVDAFVIFDDVNFVKKAFINHNSILVGGEPKKFTLELIGASQNKLINEIKVGENSNKILKTIELNYKKKPYFKITFPILEDIFNQNEKNLAKFIGYSIKKICNYFDFDKKFIYSSEIAKDNNLKGQFKIVDICKKLNTKQYVNSIGGKSLYDKKLFLARGVNLSFLEANLAKYQNLGNFMPYLSIIDIMMYYSKNEIIEILKSYKLI
tara:strand:+ start:125 stop:811 length:687 start_codon:yes stop_codon:yes gene_type:complete